MHVCMLVCMYVRMHVCVCVYVRMHACMHACMHVYLYIQRELSKVTGGRELLYGDIMKDDSDLYKVCVGTWTFAHLHVNRS